ncbi:hypothetical protein CLOP_g5892 [Closterium sp. NIES-67]|nr:hypothetical protein CLOP_g5892 [Closterium sp. NIES-67]
MAVGTEEEEEEVDEAMAIGDGGLLGGGDEHMEDDEAMMIMMAGDEADSIQRAEQAAQAAQEEARRVGQMGQLQPLLAKWRRQPVADFDPRASDIVFQQLDIDYYLTSDSPFKTHYKQSAVLRIFGVNEHGNSVCAMVHGFLPYFYVMAPTQFTYDDVAAFHTQLSERGQAKGVVVLNVEVTKAQGLLYYQGPDKKTFLKITLALPTMVAPCRAFFEGGFEWNGSHFPSTTYESNVLFALRFMIDCHVTGGNWISLPAGTYRVREDRRKMSACQLEVDILYSDLVSHEGTGQWSRMAPFRILSFDIECSGRKGHFPEPEHDPVIQIANIVSQQGSSEPLVRTVLTLNSCAPIVGCDVVSFETEQQLLLAWKELIQATDPDMIIGYNIQKFDLPYLIERAEKLNLKTFPFLGRILNTQLKMRDTRFQSRQYGTRESKEVTLDGRVQFDLLVAIQRDHKLSSYSLNSVSAHFLNEQKEDVHHSIIADLQNGDAQTRRRLAVYCLKDAYLPQRLLEKLMMVYNYVEMARVTGVPISFLLARGQSIKVLSQILRKARQRGLLVPNMKVQGVGAADATYEGATVLEPKQGFYERPVATLDFASLYPSIMMAHNLCYCTLVHKNEGIRPPDDLISCTPTGDLFVKPSAAKGILPEILEELLAARKRAKADLKKATDPLEKAVLDGRQLALKVSANSVYGFTGATIGALPCLEISSSVTAYGRQMIEHTRAFVERQYSIDNGYSHNADVVYGDTDSVMVMFGVDSVEEAMRMGRQAAEEISDTFPKPIRLEFEKVYFPYLLINKKRYAGLYWSNSKAFDKMDTKGIETVRRDNCLLVRQVVDECLRRILMERDIPGAVAYVKAVISDLLMNKLDLSLLVITKALTKGGDDYAVKAAHVQLAERMRKRDPATAPGIGDRVAYVICKAPKGSKAYEKSEDPIHVLENNIPIDPHYYLENQLSKPLLRIFEPILKNASKELLSGAHTRAVSISTPSTGGIMRFAKVRLSVPGLQDPSQRQFPNPLCPLHGSRGRNLPANHSNRARV